MNSERVWHPRAKRGLGLFVAIVLCNLLFIGVLWYAVFALVRVERDDTVRAAIDRNNNLAIAFEHYTLRTIESADAVIQFLIREYGRSGNSMDLAKFVA